MTHNLKTLPIYFNRVWSGEKKFEIRKNDRGFQVGDTLKLEEWTEKDGYTDRSIECDIKYVLYDFEGLKDGYVALGFEIELINNINKKSDRFLIYDKK